MVEWREESNKLMKDEGREGGRKGMN